MGATDHPPADQIGRLRRCKAMGPCV